MKVSTLIILPPFPIYWAGFSMIKAILELLRAATANNYHYYHLITGSDLPLVPQEEIHAFLEDSDREYVNFEPEKAYLIIGQLQPNPRDRLMEQAI